MANNRLYLYNKESNTALCIAKGFSCWDFRASKDEVNEFLNQNDFLAAAGFGPSNISLVAEDDIPSDVNHFIYDAEEKRKSIETMQRINDLFKPKPHVSFKRKLEAKKQKCIKCI
jgi:hypothetical protein